MVICRRSLVVFGVLLWACVAVLAQPSTRQFAAPVATSTVGTEPGLNLQHSLRLLAGVPCQLDRPVRVLFYGQSITEQAWWAEVASDLRTRYPRTPLEVSNLAIGGHSAELLVKAAEADVYGFGPDLVIFHAYGSHQDYEAIVRGVRQRTTADMLIATDHVTTDSALQEETRPELLSLWRWTRWAKAMWPSLPIKNWDAWHNHVFLPDLARRHSLELVDVRARWKDYLRAYGLKASQLLRDDVHLNAHGEFLMAELVKQHLQRSLLKVRACDRKRGEELLVGRDIHVKDQRLAVAFVGNRAELVFGRSPDGPLTVNVDGRPPSEHADGYSFTRTTAFPGSNWPSILRVQRGGVRLLEETWTVTVRAASSDLASIAFDIRGSATGFDGAGNSSTRFVSTSRRIVIEPGDWNLAYAKRVFKSNIPIDFQILWQAVPPGLNNVAVVGRKSNSALVSIDAIQGIPSGPHLLEVRGQRLDAIKAVRIYRPPGP